jgi:hypothetical protein
MVPTWVLVHARQLRQGNKELGNLSYVDHKRDIWGQMETRPIIELKHHNKASTSEGPQQ